MIRVDRQGFVKSDPEDVITSPEKFVIFDGDSVYFNPKWGSLKFLPKYFISYVNTLLQKYYKQPADHFDWKTVVYLVLATSKAYSALSRLFRNKKKNFKTIFYLEDLFHTVIEIYLTLLKEGKTKEEIFTYRNNSNLLESKVINYHLKVLNNIIFERSFGDDDVLDSFIYGQTEDEEM